LLATAVLPAPIIAGYDSNALTCGAAPDWRSDPVGRLGPASDEEHIPFSDSLASTQTASYVYEDEF